MPCTKVKTKKYQTRKGPPYHAKDCISLTKKGNDGKFYISVPDSKDVYKWVLKETGTRRLRQKKGGKSYKIIDNGSTPFLVDVFPSKVEVYKQTAPCVYDKKVLDSSYKDIFIGDNLLNEPLWAPKGDGKGNSILIQTAPGKYIYIGHEIYSFQTRDGENIKQYYSPIGNSRVPYPYAVGDTYTYFMLDKQTVPNEYLDLKNDVYYQFYGWKIKDDERKKKIESSKKGFKSKEEATAYAAKIKKSLNLNSVSVVDK
jgi:hypothetical protein